MIGIIGAMEQEVNELKKLMDVSKTEKKLDYTFYIGLIANKECVLVQGGIGKVNSAISTTLLLENYSIKYVLNIGSAGGLNLSQNIGDIVVSTNISYHDVDVQAFGYLYGQIPGSPAMFHADEHLRDITINILKKINKPYHCGLVVSGDTFISNSKHIKHVNNHFKDAICVEMEAASIAHVCHIYHIPFIIIRSISDIYGKGDNSIQFDEFIIDASKVSAKLCYKIVEQL